MLRAFEELIFAFLVCTSIAHAYIKYILRRLILKTQKLILQSWQEYIVNTLTSCKASGENQTIRLNPYARCYRQEHLVRHLQFLASRYFRGYRNHLLRQLYYPKALEP